jgi:antitoxin component YwqK of YwqJK toxin-antitoxin module
MLLHESYKENVWHGNHNYWYESGQKMKESIDIDGLYYRRWVTWHENGQKLEEGKWTKWDEKGQIIA